MQNIRKMPRYTAALVTALAETADPKLQTVLALAMNGMYDELIRPANIPTLHLFSQIMQQGHVELAERVAAGEFRPNDAEVDAWLATDKGMEFAKANSIDGVASFHEAMMKLVTPEFVKTALERHATMMSIVRPSVRFKRGRGRRTN